MVSGYFTARSRGQRVALVCGTNNEADAVNTQIQDGRVDRGELDPRTVAMGMGEQRLLVGDMVQTRRNDRRTGVENRAQWIVTGIEPDAIYLVWPADSGELHRVSREYALEHIQLAYGSTVHGIQGETADVAIVGPDVDAAWLYVGLTRGRQHNHAIVVATTDATARSTPAASMVRGTTEVTINDSIRAVAAELRRAAREESMWPQGYGPTGAGQSGISR
jgi:exodeoxyribonuclease V alpha subunit